MSTEQKKQTAIAKELNTIRRINAALESLTTPQKLRALNFVWNSVTEQAQEECKISPRAETPQTGSPAKA